MWGPSEKEWKSAIVVCVIILGGLAVFGWELVKWFLSIIIG